MSSHSTITSETIETFRNRFGADAGHRVSMNSIMKNGIRNSAIRMKSITDHPYVFSVDNTSCKPTDQKDTGRCWMFAGLNLLRTAAARRCRLDDFELSQSYLMFWDKLEKSNYFLENILHTVGEATDSRVVMWLLTDPLPDAGQWDMFISLVEKYGVVPKTVMPETYHSSKSSFMNTLLVGKLRQNAARLRTHCRNGERESKLAMLKNEMMNEIYCMLSHFLGEPPSVFDFEYRDKDGAFHRDLKLTPLQFHQKYIDVPLHEYVAVIHAPTEDKPFGRMYTVKYLGNVKEGYPVRYLNAHIGLLKELAVAQLRAGETVWFGCDVGKMSDRDSGVMDPALYDYEGALNCTFRMTKEERLEYRESCLTHAMVFVGVNLVDDMPNRWKVENSYGCEPGNGGYFVMSDGWFDEYVYQAVIHRRFLPDPLIQSLDQSPIPLEPWDPMGALALMRYLPIYTQE